MGVAGGSVSNAAAGGRCRRRGLGVRKQHAARQIDFVGVAVVQQETLHHERQGSLRIAWHDRESRVAKAHAIERRPLVSGVEDIGRIGDDQRIDAITLHEETSPLDVHERLSGQKIDVGRRRPGGGI